MSEQIFWDKFKVQNFTESRDVFDKLNNVEKESVLAELYQTHALTKKPIVLSILRRNLRDDQSFDDFYEEWFPEPEMCHKKSIGSQVYQQAFPAPVRVINAVNTNNAKEIYSIGITWVAGASQEELVWEYISKMKEGKDKNNETRHDKIDKVADGELVALCKVESDDNLGTPF